MKNLRNTLLSASVACAVAASLQAGETSMSMPESKQVQAPMMAESFYADNEWNIDLFGTYAFTESTNEKVLGTDHAFGGGIAANYFFARYFGVGLEGQYLENDSDGLGSAALNFAYRLPMGRFAPFTYVGGGAIFNANNIDSDNFADEFDEDDRDSNDVQLEGHAGLGVEYRFTRHFGVFSDARWTIVEDGKNNFPSARTGFRFAF